MLEVLYFYKVMLKIQKFTLNLALYFLGVGSSASELYGDYFKLYAGAKKIPQKTFDDTFITWRASSQSHHGTTLVIKSNVYSFEKYLLLLQYLLESFII